MDKNFDHFQAKFRDEAIDNINDLEQALLELEHTPKNQKLIERVFRAMHSLKGGGAMFGFVRLSEFTHKLENIYDLIRGGKLEVSSALLSATLNSVDFLRDLLNIENQDKPETLVNYKKLENELIHVVSGKTSELISKISAPESSEHNLSGEKGKEATYYISFFPDSDVQKNGTRILYLLDDIKECGDVWIQAFVSDIPPFNDFDPLKNYVRWNIFLSTKQTQNEIRDIFIFVEDQSSIEISMLSEGNLLSISGFQEKLDVFFKTQDVVSLAEIKSLVGQYQVSTLQLIKSEYSDSSQGYDKHTFEKSSSTVRVPSVKIESLMNLVSELVIMQEKLGIVNSKYEIPELKGITDSIRKLTSQLRDNTFSISLVPVQSLVTRFQRLVRDLSSSLGKKIVLETEGTETELDKSIIETLSDPLMHILRNCADHGIEIPEERKIKGKPERGTIHLNAYYAGANVMIEVFDDGQGINPGLIRSKAIEKGIIKEDEILTTQEILDLIFVPGFSTATEVTDVSGRGVGMDVVKRKISSIRGTVSLKSSVNEGTKFIIKLPLVLSIVDTLLVNINNSQYILPLSQIEKINPVTSLQIKESFSGLLTMNGEQYPFFDLRKELSPDEDKIRDGEGLIVSHTRGQMVLLVDSVVGKMQAVLKPLGSLYADHGFISAATIMGDGAIALMLDPNAIIEEFL